jgi:hypothetical protein
MLNDVWFTRDGDTWQELEADTIFCPRHEISPYVFNDRLWVSAGLVPPLSNEVWSLQLPDDF